MGSVSLTAGTTPGGEGLRARKKEATRRALADAALRLAVERGPVAVTVEDIAAAVDVSTRTFFNYFGSKDEAILGVGHLALLGNLAARPADEPALRALRNAIVESVAGVETHPEEWDLRRRLMTDHPSLLPRFHAEFARFERELTLEVATRTGRDADLDPYAALIVSCALGAARSALQSWQSRGSSTSLADVLDETFRYLADGFGGA
jgi:AcrR family transcriptional regulator